MVGNIDMNQRIRVIFMQNYGQAIFKLVAFMLNRHGLGLGGGLRRRHRILLALGICASLLLTRAQQHNAANQS